MARAAPAMGASTTLTTDRLLTGAKKDTDAFEATIRPQSLADIGEASPKPPAQEREEGNGRHPSGDVPRRDHRRFAGELEG